MSFSCPHCHYSDSEIQPGGPIQDEGVKYTVQVDTREVNTRGKSLLLLFCILWSNIDHNGVCPNTF